MRWLSATMWAMILGFSAWSIWCFYTDDWGEGIVTVVVAVICLLLHAFVWRPIAKREALAKRLKKIGREAAGKITAAQQTNTYINNLPVMRYTVSYTFEGAPYSAEKRMPVPHSLLGSMGVNSQVTVLVDPKNPEECVITL